MKILQLCFTIILKIFSRICTEGSIFVVFEINDLTNEDGAFLRNPEKTPYDTGCPC